MLDKLDNPREFFTHKLGSALSMEQHVLKMLGKLEEEATSPDLKQQLNHHAGETRGHVRNVELAFEALGEKPDDKPALPILAIEKEGQLDVHKAQGRMVDAAILAGATETEHLEIATYEALIAHAEALGEPAIVNLLQQNLESEQHTLDEVRAAQRRTASELALAPA